MNDSSTVHNTLMLWCRENEYKSMALKNVEKPESNKKPDSAGIRAVKITSQDNR